ncbi:hypothetical protein PSY49_23450, partial [Shigella flexneri]|nr:hypothetical protein [Shigella flexneri]
VMVIIIIIFTAAPVIYGGSQARGQIGAAAADLHHSHSHSHTRSKLHLRPIPKLAATGDQSDKISRDLKADY